ncbi:MAG: Asp-tRNA(Asn)/Glu-tRNA(Gln) amidotransferase subunit GatC [bacterium]
MIKKEEIKHVADLAKLEINDEEAEKYSKELSKVVDYVDQLKEVDTEGVEPTAQVAGMVNQTRNDKVVDWDESERKNSLKKNIDETGQIKVPKVLNNN